jgi:hypothetical protein
MRVPSPKESDSWYGAFDGATSYVLCAIALDGSRAGAIPSQRAESKRSLLDPE